MTEQPWNDPIDSPGDVGDAQLPGPEDGPVLAPRDIPEPDPNDGDLDVGETPPGRR